MSVMNSERDACKDAAENTLLVESTASEATSESGKDGKVSRRGFLKAGVTAAAILVGVPVVSSLFLRDSEGPNSWEEGGYTVVKGMSTSYQHLELAECEWVWPNGHSNPIASFAVRNRSDNMLFRDVAMRIMLVSATGHLLCEQAVTIPSILPGETCHMAGVLGSNVDGWIGGDRPSGYGDDFDHVEVLVSKVGEVVLDVDDRSAWPYNVEFSPRTLREYASVELTLAHDRVEKALLGDAILGAACVFVLWRNDQGELLEAESWYVEGLEVGVSRVIELSTFEKSTNMEVYVRPWRRDENAFFIFKGVDVEQRRW